MRVIFYTFLCIVGISLSVIILMPSLFDINNYKAKIENLFFNKTNNTLNIAGEIRLSFFSGLRLSVKDISFVANDGENLFKSEELLLSPRTVEFYLKRIKDKFEEPSKKKLLLLIQSSPYFQDFYQQLDSEFNG